MVQTNPSPSQHMLGSHLLSNYRPIDKLKSSEESNDTTRLTTTSYDDISSLESALTQVGATAQATANAAGTTTTFVTTNADAGNLSVGDIVYLYNSAGTLLETERKVTAIALDTPSLGNATVTFEPAADVATATGDILKSVVYNVFRMNSMTVNDKIHAIAQSTDSEMVG